MQKLHNKIGNCGRPRTPDVPLIAIPPGHPTPAEIAASRIERQLTQAEAARRVGRSLRTWQAWERGTAVMSVAVWQYWQGTK